MKLHLGVELHRGCEALGTTVRNKLLLLEGPSPCSPAQALPSDVVLRADLAPYRKHNVRREKATKRLIQEGKRGSSDERMNGTWWWLAWP